ncbi:hypothetical protein ACI68E_002485 [Malassezia pachydermatis]
MAQTLAQFSHLRRLDLSNMESSEACPHGLEQLHWIATAVRRSRKHVKEGQTPLDERLTWLNIAGNPALGASDDALDGLELLTALHVFNASHCLLKSIPSGLSALRGLKALVLSHNALTSLPAVFPHLPDLNTLVLSNNQLTHLPSTLPTSLPSLKKLSISHNALQGPEALPDWRVCSHLREVRLCGNPTLQQLPSHIQFWGCGVDGGAPGLALLDISNCGLSSWRDVEALLRPATSSSNRHGLANLCAKGNGIAALDDYQDRWRASYPHLHVLDQVRLVPKKKAELPLTDSVSDVDKDDALPTRVQAAPVKTLHTPKERASVSRDERPRASKREAVSKRVSPSSPSKRDDTSTAKRGETSRPKHGDTVTQKRHASSTPKRQREEEVDDEAVTTEKKVRKRSKRGPKKRAEAATLPEAPQSVPATTSTSKPKKIRRKKTVKTVELDMDSTPLDAAPPSPPRVSQRTPSPPPTKPAVSVTGDTGIVGVVNVKRARPAVTSTPASFLGRRDDTPLGGW